MSDRHGQQPNLEDFNSLPALPSPGQKAVAEVVIRFAPEDLALLHLVSDKLDRVLEKLGRRDG